MTALGRPGQPAELASIHVQLAAADASFATGQDDRHDTPAGRPAAFSTRPKFPKRTKSTRGDAGFEVCSQGLAGFDGQFGNTRMTIL